MSDLDQLSWNYAILAQSVERVTCNLEVFGSTPEDGWSYDGKHCKGLS